MRLFFLTVLLISSITVSSVFAQGTVPTPCGDVCPICETRCLVDCIDCALCIDQNCGEGVPINSHLALLLISGAIYGIRVIRSGYFKRKE